MFVRRVDEQIRGLLSCRAQDYPIADRDDVATVRATLHAGKRLARSRSNVLALVPDTGGTLADRETAAFAEIVSPGQRRPERIVRLGALRTVAAPVQLGGGEGRRVRERKADLRIDGVVHPSGLAAESSAGEKLARPIVAKRMRHGGRALDRQRFHRAQISRHAADDAQRPKEAKRDLI